MKVAEDQLAHSLAEKRRRWTLPPRGKGSGCEDFLGTIAVDLGTGGLGDGWHMVTIFLGTWLFDWNRWALNR